MEHLIRFNQNGLYSSRRKDPQDKTLEHGHQFRIKHYAGDVTYSINGFIDKSKDLVFQDFKVFKKFAITQKTIIRGTNDNKDRQVI